MYMREQLIILVIKADEGVGGELRAYPNPRGVGTEIWQKKLKNRKTQKSKKLTKQWSEIDENGILVGGMGGE